MLTTSSREDAQSINSGLKTETAKPKRGNCLILRAMISKQREHNEMKSSVESVSFSIS